MIKKFILVVSIILSSIVSYTAPFSGGFFKIEQIIGSNSYSVSFIFYRNCDAINTTSINVDFACSSNPSYNFSASLPKVNTNADAFATCQSAYTICSTGQLFGADEITFNSIVTLPPCSDWTISFKDGFGCCRNPSTTIANANSFGFYIETSINNLVNTNNQISYFKKRPNLVAYTNQAYEFDYSVENPDGDSISYSLITPYYYSFLGSSPNYVTYNAGFSAQQPFTSNPPIQFDSTSGKMSFTATQLQTAVVAVQVEEWRNINGTMTLLSKNMIDHEIHFVQGSNISPMLSGLDSTETSDYFNCDTLTNMIVLVETPFRANIYGHDDDSSTSSSPNKGTFNIDWDGGISGAGFAKHNQNTDQAYATFVWIPSSSDNNKIKSFTASIEDDACPYIGFNSKTYRFLVKDSSSLAIVPQANGLYTTTICNHESIELTAPNGFDHFLWSTNETTQSITLDSTDLNIGANHYTCLLRVNDFEFLSEITIFMDDCTGIEDYEKTMIQIYPNPASDLLNIEIENYESTFNVEIIDLQGKVIISNGYTNKQLQQIDISELKEGMYLIKVWDQTKESFQRFIKQ